MFDGMGQAVGIVLAFIGITLFILGFLLGKLI